MDGSLTGKRIDHYLLGQCLGKGHFGIVYQADDLEQNIKVAVKVLTADADKDHLINLLKEARAFRHQHPHIVRIIDFGIARGDQLYLVMNYIPNGNLRQRHPIGTRLPWETVVRYVQQVAEALQYIHEKKIVHRDVKPENMLVGENDEIILGDFGIAVASLTWESDQAQRPRGTPLYIAPEQSRGRAVRASDQYALGVVMYEWLAGRPPFEGSTEEVIMRRLAAPAPPLRNFVSDLPPGAEEIVMRMLAKEPENRFASMRELREALEQVGKKVPTLQPLVFSEHTDGVRSVSWSPDGRFIASGGRDRTVQVWDAASGAVVYIYQGQTEDIWSVAWSPDSRFVVSACADYTIRAWEATTGNPGPISGEHKDMARVVAWSPNGKWVASAGDDREICVWDVASGALWQTYDPRTESVSALAWSPSSGLLASGGDDGEIYLWSGASATRALPKLEHARGITSLAWSPDGKYLASASDNKTVCIWDTTTWREQHTYAAHKDVVSAIAWLPQGQETRILASASWDQTVHVWALGETQPRLVYSGHRSWVNSLSGSPDGRYLVSGSWDKTVHIFTSK